MSCCYNEYDLLNAGTLSKCFANAHRTGHNGADDQTSHTAYHVPSHKVALQKHCRWRWPAASRRSSLDDDAPRGRCTMPSSNARAAPATRAQPHLPPALACSSGAVHASRRRPAGASKGRHENTQFYLARCGRSAHTWTVVKNARLELRT